MGEDLLLHVHLPDKRDVVVHRNTSDPVGSLGSCLGELCGSYILHKGFLLGSQFSFGFHGVKDGDHLYILKESRLVSHPVRFVLPKPSLRGGGLGLDLARSIDRAFDKNEANELFRGLFSDKDSFTPNLQTFLQGEQKDGPSTEALPMIW